MTRLLPAIEFVTFWDATVGIYMSILLVLCTYVNISTILEALR